MTCTPRSVKWNFTTELAEPAAAIRSPGAAMKRQQQPASASNSLSVRDASLLIGKAELGRVGSASIDASEQLHVHQLARFDDVDVRRESRDSRPPATCW